ncbi:MAG TPA: DUF1501 domain-containing protein [Gemmataceae bacterium]|jgi:hypothetical protein|nr:DUF1501 domain-containing protein [Gemmataceae bacterium]
MDRTERIKRQLTRRAFLGRSSGGMGMLALASLLDPELLRAGAAPGRDTADHWEGAIRPRHHTARAKRVIYLYMAGGPSHLETLDYKPMLAKMNGKPMPESFTKGQPIAQLQGQKLNCFGPQHRFKKVGRSGQQISEIFPRLGTVADDLCIIRSMRTEAINHDPAHTFMNTGTTISGRPAMGSWVVYGLGSEGNNLPGFVVLISTGKAGQSQPISARQWHSGFLPSRFQGVEFRSKGEPVLYVGSPKGVDAGRQRDVVEAVEALNRMQNSVVDDPEIATRVSQYEMAFRMQTSVPGLMDLADEPKEVLDLYGTRGGDGSFAANCLLARRLAERGVRFIQLYHRDWDHHSVIRRDVQITAAEVDQGAAALLKDLKRRGMLDDTLVIWGGEFGRTPMAQGDGRDHHIKGFSLWMAGGGIKGGISHGGTDELGYNAVEDVVEVNDLHATMLHLMGIEHKKLTYKFQGRDFRLTDVRGNVVRSILA